MDIAVNKSTYNRNKISPLKFALWASLASISMMFAGFLSAYLVRQAAGNWFEFVLPNLFLGSTGIIILSSVTMHRAVKAFREEDERLYKSMLLATFCLGIVFIITQYQGWLAMQAAGIDLKGNPSGAFVYLISGVHVAHVVGGIAALFVALIHGFTLPFKVTERRKTRLDITAHYWHYVDVLWVVLYLFLTFYR